MRIIFCILFLICINIFPCYCQEDVTINKNDKKFLLKWTPTSLIGYPSLQFAGELFFNPYKSFQIEYGIILPNIGLPIYGRSDYKGHRVRIEQRNYFSKNEKWYFAPELHFTFVKYSEMENFSQNWKTDSITGDRYALDIYIDTIVMKETVFSGNFKVGFQHIFTNPRLSLDIYCGFGLRHVITRFAYYPTVGEYVPPVDPVRNIEALENNRFTPNIVFGVKIGYQIK
ncbi:MAG TPA: hypothetical protein PLG05_08430 [Bacteroidales bacterium]|nr:hypothetical protein [Bacteroidales bacterium]HPL05190.1 hypothetical protein [Bacteroidales bacterium]